MHLAGGGVVGRIVDVQLCTGERVGCYTVLLQDRQRGLDRVEKGHRAGAAGLQIDHLCDTVTAHGEVRQKGAAPQVCRDRSLKTAVDLLDLIGHIRDGIHVGDVLF